MKRYLLVLFAVAFTLAVNGQRRVMDDNNRIQALKIAFITQKLSLTSDEAQKFWPVYNKYNDEVSSLVPDKNGDVIARDEKLLKIKKKYNNSFEKILGRERANQLFIAEAEFRNVLIRQLKSRKGGMRE